MSKVLFLLVVSSVLLLISCGGVDSETKKIVSELNTSYTHQGKQVELQGYLVPGFMNMVSNGKVSISLKAAASQEAETLVANVELNHGQSTPNRIYFPEEFHMENVELYDSGGKNFSCEDKVKITGTVSYIAKEAKAEGDESADKANDYSYLIKDVVIAKAN